MNNKVVRTKWSRDELIKMIIDPVYEPHELRNINGVEVRRLFLEGRPCIQKRFPSGLSARQIAENSFLVFGGQDTEIKQSIARMVNFRDDTQRPLEIYTRWHGLDLRSWHDLLGPQTPFLKSIQGVLALIKGIVSILHPIHDRDFIHNDLIRANIVLDFEFDKAKKVGTLKIAAPRLIDFEYSYFPRNSPSGLPRRTGSLWSNKHKQYVCLCPKSHSQNVIPYEMVFFSGEFQLVEYEESEIDLAQGKGFGSYENQSSETMIFIKPDSPQWKLGDEKTEFSENTEWNKCKIKATAVENIGKVDFGVDFFSLGIMTERMIEDGMRYWSEEHKENYSEALVYLKSLPAKFIQYDVLSNIRRNLPHREIISDVDKYIANFEVDTTFKLNIDEKSPIVGRANFERTGDSLSDNRNRITDSLSLSNKENQPQSEEINLEGKLNNHEDITVMREIEAPPKRNFYWIMSLIKNNLGYSEDENINFDDKTLKVFETGKNFSLREHVSIFLLTLFSLGGWYFLIIKYSSEKNNMDLILLLALLIPMIFISNLFICTLINSIFLYVGKLRDRKWSFNKFWKINIFLRRFALLAMFGFGIIFQIFELPRLISLIFLLIVSLTWIVATHETTMDFFHNKNFSIGHFFEKQFLNRDHFSRIVNLFIVTTNFIAAGFLSTLFPYFVFL